MLYPKDRNIYRPPHIYLNDTFYFITSRTFNKKEFFNTDFKKSLLLQVIKEATRQFKCLLVTWVILNNHYHLLLELKYGKDLAKLMKIINGRSSRRLRKLLSMEGRLISLPSWGWKVWHNYWDHCIRGERDFWMHFNYIHHNPIKHGYVNRIEDYKFSSYNNYMLKYGKEWLDEVFEDYPIIDFTPQDL